MIKGILKTEGYLALADIHINITLSRLISGRIGILTPDLRNVDVPSFLP